MFRKTAENLVVTSSYKLDRVLRVRIGVRLKELGNRIFLMRIIKIIVLVLICFSTKAQHDKLMLGNTIKYPKISKTAIQTPFINFRIDTTFKFLGLEIEEIGFRKNNQLIFLEATFKKPVPDLSISAKLFVFDKDSVFFKSESSTSALNRYQNKSMSIFIDFGLSDSSYAVLQLVSSKKIVTSKSDIVEKELESSFGDWITKPINDIVGSDPNMPPAIEVFTDSYVVEEDAINQNKLPPPRRKGKIEKYRSNDKNLFGFRIDDEIVIEAKYRDIDKDYSDFIIAQDKNGKWGAIDGKGNEKIPFQYLKLFRPSSKLFNCFVAGRKDNEGFALIDSFGMEITPFRWKQIFWDGDIVMLSDNGLQQMFNNQFKLLLETNYELWANTDLSGVLKKEKLIKFRQNGKFGLINYQNEIILPAEYNSIGWIKNNLFAVEKTYGKWGIVNQKNEIVLPFEYKDISIPNNEGILSVSKLGMCGLMDTIGQLLFKFEYDKQCTCEKLEGSNLFKVFHNEKVSLANADGNLLFPFQYTGFSTNSKAPNLIFAYQPINQYFFLDTNGKLVSSDTFDIYSCYKTAISVFQNNKHGLFSTDGRRITTSKYRSAYGIDDIDKAKKDNAHIKLPIGNFIIGYGHYENDKVVIIDNLGNEYPIK